MDVSFRTTKLEKSLNTHKLLVRIHGDKRAGRIRRRLDDLAAADTLDDMRYLPGRCHELSGDRAGQLALDLDHPYRLIFAPAHNPLPLKEDGGLDWTAITAIEILEIEDYHG